jgi:hypothetical protein
MVSLLEPGREQPVVNQCSGDCSEWSPLESGREQPAGQYSEDCSEILSRSGEPASYCNGGCSEVLSLRAM